VQETGVGRASTIPTVVHGSVPPKLSSQVNISYAAMASALKFVFNHQFSIIPILILNE